MGTLRWHSNTIEWRICFEQKKRIDFEFLSRKSSRVHICNEFHEWAEPLALKSLHYPYMFLTLLPGLKIGTLVIKTITHCFADGTLMVEDAQVLTLVERLIQP